MSTIHEPAVMRRLVGAVGAVMQRTTRAARSGAALITLCAAFTLTPVAMAKSTGYLFVSSEKDHSVTVLDGNTYEVVKQIRTAARPRHMTFSPDRSQIYVACGDGDAIDIIDIAKLELVDRILGIEDPEAFEFSPDGKTLYISLEDTGELGILDLDAYFAARSEKPELVVAEVSESDDAREEDDDDDDEDEDKEGNEGGDDGEKVTGLTTIEVGEEPEGILVSPDGSRVFVTSEVANMVHVVDSASATLGANIVVGNRPRRFALSPDGNDLWVTSELAGSVSVIDLASSNVVRTIEFKPKGFRPEDVTPVGIVMTKDGGTAWVALGRANHVAVLDTASGKVDDYVLVGNRAWNVALSRDESTLFVTNGLSDDVSIVDAKKRKVTRSVPVGRVPYAVLVDGLTPCVPGFVQWCCWSECGQPLTLGLPSPSI